ncbi:hypothetical protein [Steroidobacter agaridevorans]|uniref:hypothetical protein n=1 Tax=Steroidobacter agaridevorans TaxID=2695856 RepID=UPI00132B88A2|nr:hypothetical protein [Steroidobacter agaridevorans]GFE87795.1 hypothetical protein GCM10011488_27490 [Steroidobacter agaridevorans]
MANPRERSPSAASTVAGTWRRAADVAAAALDPPRPEVDRVTFGRFIDHGPGRHEGKPDAPQSYFVKLATERGERVFWSPALKTALAQSRTQPKIGEQVGVRENSILPATVLYSARDSAGKVVEQRRFDSPRTHWAIEERAFYDEALLAAEALRSERLHPREAIKTYPQLLPAYLALDSARRVAKERVSPTQRDRFVSLVRETLAHAVERGMPLPVLERRTADAPAAPSVAASSPATSSSSNSSHPIAVGPRVTTRPSARTR